MYSTSTLTFRRDGLLSRQAVRNERGARAREQTEGVVVAQVALQREEQAAEVVERAQLARLEARVLHARAVQRHLFVGLLHRGAQPAKLQPVERRARHQLGLAVEEKAPRAARSVVDLAGEPGLEHGVHELLLSVRRAPAGAAASIPG